MQNGTATLENNVAVSYQHKCIPKIPLNIYPSPREIKTYVHTKTVFVIKKLETNQMFSTGGLINKLWYTDTVQNYLETRRNKLLIYTSTWRNLKYIMQSEKPDLKMLHVVWFHLYVILERLNYRARNQISGCQGLEWEEGLTPKGHAETLGDDGTVLYLDSGAYTSICQNS